MARRTWTDTFNGSGAPDPTHFNVETAGGGTLTQTGGTLAGAGTTAADGAMLVCLEKISLSKRQRYDFTFRMTSVPQAELFAFMLINGPSAPPVIATAATQPYKMWHALTNVSGALRMATKHLNASATAYFRGRDLYRYRYWNPSDPGLAATAWTVGATYRVVIDVAALASYKTVRCLLYDSTGAVIGGCPETDLETGLWQSPQDLYVCIGDPFSDYHYGTFEVDSFTYTEETGGDDFGKPGPWTVVDTGSTEDLVSIDTDQWGHVTTGGGNAICRTLDGGETWTERTPVYGNVQKIIGEYLHVLSAFEIDGAEILGDGYTPVAVLNGPARTWIGGVHTTSDARTISCDSLGTQGKLWPSYTIGVTNGSAFTDLRWYGTGVGVAPNGVVKKVSALNTSKITFTTCTTPASSNTLRKTSLGPLGQVAVGDGGHIIYCTTGTAFTPWLAATSPTTDNFTGVTCNRQAGYWAAVTEGGDVYISSDMINWTFSSNTGLAVTKDITYDWITERFIACGTGGEIAYAEVTEPVVTPPIVSPPFRCPVLFGAM